MSEIKQEILDLLILNGRKPQSIKSGERVVYLYDALNIVNKEFSKTDQPQLKENQLIVLKWLKDKYTITDIEPIELFWRLHVNTKNKFRTLLAYRAYKSLTRKAQLEVLSAFAQWALEQEAE